MKNESTLGHLLGCILACRFGRAQTKKEAQGRSQYHLPSERANAMQRRRKTVRSGTTFAGKGASTNNNTSRRPSILLTSHCFATGFWRSHLTASCCGRWTPFSTSLQFSLHKCAGNASFLCPKNWCFLLPLPAVRLPI